MLSIDWGDYLRLANSKKRILAMIEQILNGTNDLLLILLNPRVNEKRKKRKKGFQEVDELILLWFEWNCLFVAARLAVVSFLACWWSTIQLVFGTRFLGSAKLAASIPPLFADYNQISHQSWRIEVGVIWYPILHVSYCRSGVNLWWILWFF